MDVTQFVMRPEEGLPSDTPLSQTGFTLGGEPAEADHRHCLAKTTANAATGERQFYVRSCTKGYQANNFFNPAVHTLGELWQESATTGRPQFEFRKVTQVAFNDYLRFLKSGNPAVLRTAERVQ